MRKLQVWKYKDILLECRNKQESELGVALCRSVFPVIINLQWPTRFLVLRLQIILDLLLWILCWPRVCGKKDLTKLLSLLWWKHHLARERGSHERKWDWVSDCTWQRWGLGFGIAGGIHLSGLMCRVGVKCWIWSGTWVLLQSCCPTSGQVEARTESRPQHWWSWTSSAISFPSF